MCIYDFYAIGISIAKIQKNRRKYVRLESYFLLKHAIQWTAPPEYSSVSFQSYLLYFCTAVQFLCFCNGLFLLYSNERFFAFRTSYVLLCFCTSGTFSLVSQLTFSVDRTSLSSDFQLLPVFSIRLFLCWMFLYECFSFVCLYYNSFCVFVNTFFYKNINFCKILHFWYFFSNYFLIQAQHPEPSSDQSQWQTELCRHWNDCLPTFQESVPPRRHKASLLPQSSTDTAAPE